ncbi:restriction endonuclease subunit S [Anaerostipes hadrus]|jgi:type I restriction enzyme S subunit|uniref:restriction endonuclease subunit S n=1 Tax=Anaerostipes hadrus TaxID=649756 RepID=UPI00156E9AF0|nr:restriction endonuclease subunit S [Anaerostipes hadrus]MCO7162840.1 restriction endonuclease subunit S [Anaerostipes hadrus]NSH00123.1 restriction endonuclease subunit S [Anaerostipes hadrus]
MKYIKLKDVCKINMGQSPDSSSYNESGEGIPFFQGNADFGDRYPVTRIWCSEPKKVAQENDILISVRAPIGAINYSKEKCCIGRGLAALTVDKTKISEKLLFWVLKAKKEELNRQGTGSTFKAISKKSLEELLIPQIDIKEQEKDVEILEKIYMIIQNKHKELKLLTDLISARFVEMFGDPIRNTQNRPTTKLINVVKMQRGFDLPVQDRNQDGNIPVYGANGVLDSHNTARIHGGGVITGRSGTIGKVFYTEGDYWPLNTSLFSVDKHGNNVIYLAYLLQMFDLTRFVEGTGVPTLNRNMFHNRQIIDVPINEQNQFAAFVQQVNKSKFEVQKSLEKTQLLFDSLMQEYFG